jgi:hypothetical protein
MNPATPPTALMSSPSSEPGVQGQGTVPVTVDNFIRAETDMYFGVPVKMAGAIGKFYHDREVAPVDKQLVIRGNRDTLYSTGVWDLDAGPVTVTLPDGGKRFRSMIVITEDQYMPAVYYEPGAYTFTREQIGTRYVFLGVRTFFNPNDQKDVETVHALQDATKVSHPGGPGTFETPAWDAASQKVIRDALVVLYSTLPDQNRMFGTKEHVDPVRRLIGAAGGWGGNPESDAIYVNVTPAKNDGSTAYRLTVPRDVPVDGFWSISVYDASGYFFHNSENAYSLNNITASKSADGSVDVQFGGESDGKGNHFPIVKGWNYLVRLYRPRKQIIDGTWKFPEAWPVQ